MQHQPRNDTYCGYVAIVGAPNAGKSTLLNALVGSSLSIVTPKPQTTRGQLRGIVNVGAAQIILVDTPGIFDAQPKFEKAMVDAAWRGAQDADIIVLLVDSARGLDNDTKCIASAIKAQKRPAMLALNKVDKVEKRSLPELAKMLYDLCDFERSFMISASRGEGVTDVLRALAERLPKAPWLYPEDTLTDISERALAAEITREQCFLRLHEELPYGLMVETEKWEEKDVKGTRTIRINQAVIVQRESHKKILLGAGGAMLKSIGSASRRKIGEMLSATVHLFLFVKVDAAWKESREGYKAAGLEFKA